MFTSAPLILLTNTLSGAFPYSLNCIKDNEYIKAQFAYSMYQVYGFANYK